MRNFMLALILVLSTAIAANAQDPYPGETLISPLNLHDSFLIDLDGTVLRTWHGGNRPMSNAYLLDDYALLRPNRDPNGTFDAAGAGGWIQIIDADDTVIWEYMFSDDEHQQHHDIQPLPNGNVLLIAWERKTQEEGEAMGRVGLSGEMWPTLIVEVQPVGPTSGDIVWEWHLWDHIIQDVDPGKPNYGVIADHPELLDINASNVPPSGDWIHSNSIDYNAELDQILFSARGTDEFYIIDHSTSSAQAAGHSGGHCGMGGDFLYRWGNAPIYGRGDESDHYFHVIHGANWIDPGLPGAGHVLAVNNGDDTHDPGVYEVAVPVNESGCYDIEPGLPFEPDTLAWSFENLDIFDPGPTHGGAFRHPNGNTLITSPRIAEVIEVTPAGDLVWNYLYTSGNIPRAERYWNDGVGVITPDGDTPALATPRLSARPNPFNPSVRIDYLLPRAARVELAVFGIAGRRIVTLGDGFEAEGEHTVTWHGEDEGGNSLSSGVYLLSLRSGGARVETKLVLIR